MGLASRGARRLTDNIRRINVVCKDLEIDDQKKSAIRAMYYMLDSRDGRGFNGAALQRKFGLWWDSLADFLTDNGFVKKDRGGLYKIT